MATISANHFNLISKCFMALLSFLCQKVRPFFFINP